ncbi:catalase family peroxidase [Chelatococcus sambhunathii]|uniref:Catalase-related peroxidase n=1 Tax=Chelatococcus sambhunathii TaxID=363953 RepID=A0ABU1DCU7_9HYPH|nr:catalase family peroxidase [Chelatococcus sambhunathii]MDR4305933.1 catalase family peroxidase [Chelatococcus sambhunathii]
MTSDRTGEAGRLPKRAIALRLGAIAATLCATTAAFAYAGGWLSPGALTPARIVDTFERINGRHDGFRRNHAKGVCVSGVFQSSGAAAPLSKASVFRAGETPVTGRFALAGGRPYAADATATVRSLALRFQLPGGEEWRTGMNDIPVFPVSTPAAFQEQLIASAPDPATGKPDPARMAAFFAAHPESAKAVALIKARVVMSGFADDTFNSLNAFRFRNDDGAVSSVRWAVVPIPTGTVGEPAPADDKNGLFEALIKRVNADGAPARWRLVVTVGAPEDPTNDATLPWPAGRRTVDAGTLVIDHVEGEAEGRCRDVNFDPLILPAGIEPSDDPLLSARSAAYARSFTRREGEPKAASAVATLTGGTR